MKAFKLGMPIFMIVLGLVFLFAAMNLPKANLGNPNGPIYFPIGLSVLLLIFSIIYLFQELKNIDKENEKIKELLSGRTVKLIGMTVLFGIIYAIILDAIGFLIATALFLGALLFLVNGFQKWKANLIVAVVFSIVSWYSFSELLGVSLP
ncbi:tripartite tricarboxylate transporter TctB family protein [Oceanobacillus massiliensis]|uniref:tripartite tricarboxylate transporter TctB family protein n=1 Tax=Oceanobacillus massiliensis TaxID=1465765 RepID=UPI00028A407C|nr:tripartite tricarboxylate transporter TctB family protein [Oceanobacillus massiliensis]